MATRARPSRRAVIATDAADLTLTELLPMLANRTLSARELLADCLRRIYRADPSIQAFVTQTPDLAAAAADRADRARAAGTAVGALAGVPVALKDVFRTKGVRTTAGSQVLATYVPQESSAAWGWLEAAGAGLLGKTTTHEFAYGTTSGPTANPWDLRRSPGGSSGGSAAAVAGRMVPIALGTDTGGSLRIPAAACGISTLRSPRGRIPLYGVIPLSPTFDVAGPMARRMLDISLLMRVPAGPAAVPGYPLDPPQDLSGVRIGLPTAMSWEPVDDQVATVCRLALDVLVARGAELVKIGHPPNTEAVLAKSTGVFDTVTEYEARLVHDALITDSHLYTPQVLERVRSGEQVSPERYAEALALRARWESDWRTIIATHRLDAIAHPTLDAAPPLLDGTRPPEGPALRQSLPWSIADFAVLSVPAGFEHRGLPVGLSLAGLPEREAELVGLGVVIDEELELWRSGPPLMR
ncbi:amidase [Kribbella sp. NPDC056951]|uniref:amidase n=1 Tax=Kribbella sp. NPDC056951 TaxID=3345978 RepID=UPI00364406C9